MAFAECCARGGPYLRLGLVVLLEASESLGGFGLRGEEVAEEVDTRERL